MFEEFHSRLWVGSIETIPCVCWVVQLFLTCEYKVAREVVSVHVGRITWKGFYLYCLARGDRVCTHRESFHWNPCCFNLTGPKSGNTRSTSFSDLSTLVFKCTQSHFPPHNKEVDRQFHCVGHPIQNVYTVLPQQVLFVAIILVLMKKRRWNSLNSLTPRCLHSP